MLRECRANFRTTIKQKRENTLRQTALSSALSNHLRDELAGTGMRRMGFYDDRIPGGECGSAVPSSYRESQREVTRSEHHDRSQRTQPGTDIRPGSGLAVGVGSVNPRGNPRPILRHFCK